MKWAINGFKFHFLIGCHQEVIVYLVFGGREVLFRRREGFRRRRRLFGRGMVAVGTRRFHSRLLRAATQVAGELGVSGGILNKVNSN